MGQYEVYAIINKLGGKATTKQIKENLLKKYPNFAYHTYVYYTLKKLVKNEYIQRITNENNETIYEIIDEWQY